MCRRNVLHAGMQVRKGRDWYNEKVKLLVKVKGEVYGGYLHEECK